MKKSLFCEKSVKNKYCNTSCQNKHRKITGSGRKEKLTIRKFCPKCFSSFEVKCTEKSKGKTKKFCSRKCANSRCHSDEVKKKISKTLEKPKQKLNCQFCKKDFTRKIKRKFCSQSCASKAYHKQNPNHARKIGRLAARARVKRSKNEIMFYELCLSEFSDVVHNEPIFNGWDADVVLKNEKIAILWNGKWHYEKITQSHSLKQVQNRDRIKTKEIIKLGFTPYIIKDMGKHNKKFVIEEFDKFLLWLEK